MVSAPGWGPAVPQGADAPHVHWWRTLYDRAPEGEAPAGLPRVLVEAAAVTEAGLGPVIDAAPEALRGELRTLLHDLQRRVPNLADQRVVSGGGGSIGPAQPAPMLAEGAIPRMTRNAKTGRWGGAAIVAVIDAGLPMAHPRLAHRGASRVAAHWAMDARAEDAPADPAAALPFGRELTGPRIDALPRSADPEAPYRAAGLRDARLLAGLDHGRATHGAGVIDLAAGLDPADPAGRQHPVIGVSLPREVTRETLGTFAPAFLALALLYVVDRAARLREQIAARLGAPVDAVDLPVAVNLSYGVTAGRKDGLGAVERLHDRLMADPERVGLSDLRIVVPMGNHRQARLAGLVEPEEAVILRLPPGDETPSHVELWGRGGTGLQIGLTPPGGEEAVTELTAGMAQDLGEAARAYRMPGARNGLLLAFPPTAPRGASRTGRPGDWRLRVIGDAAAEISVQRDDSLPALPSGGRQPRLVDPGWQARDPTGRARMEDGSDATVRRAGSVNAYATGRHQRRVAAARSDGTLADYSGRADGGPAPDGDVRHRVDRSAVLRGRRTSGGLAGSRMTIAGTSAAAAIETRALARALASGAAPPLPDRRGG